uniref:CID domain-containing protein n=1 Tax=Globisporangium ultimum (strain ATCC 200006 / CBS 805.95 / DAOM BR144) TaxID=431595 RepID=K3WVA8_GLOUD
MAMAQFAATNGTTAAASGGSDAASSAHRPSKQEVQAVLGQFDAKINQMMDYPAKDIINALTKLAERLEFAPEIVSFLETKIHRVIAQFKLPIFYLTDSILKNVRGPYPALFGRIIVPLYCNCVKQVSGKDLRRFIHVLNTWEATRLFAKDALAQMRASANKAQSLAEPSLMTQPASFSQQQPPPSQSRRSSSSAMSAAQQQQDLELRALLTKLQNDMGIHPTEHMSLEEVRTNNPDYYSQLLEFHAAAQRPPVATPEPIPSHVDSILGAAPGQPIAVPRQPIRDPRRGVEPVISQPPPAVSRQSPPAPRPTAPVTPAATTSTHSSPAKSANVAHLMQLLKKKKRSPSPPRNEITNDPPRAPDAAAVMSILQKLKGLTQSEPPAPVVNQHRVPRGPPPPPTPQQLQQFQQQFQTPPPPPPVHQYNESGSSRMWFSDKIVTHKDRVESNVQKLYAALPLVCRESGLRFKEQEKLNAHLDFLFQYNRSVKERGKGGISRSWYPDEDQWVTDFAGEKAPRESTSSSFFDRKESEDDANDSWEDARVPVDESVTKCRICGESFTKKWDEEEEDWMYTNAVVGTIHNPAVPDGSADQETIFHKYCYDTVTSNSKHITMEHLIPGTPQGIKPKGQFASVDSEAAAGVKRALEEEEDSDSDEDVKRIKTN